MNRPILLPSPLVIPAGTELQRAPAKTERFGVHFCVDIAIDKDHTATLTLDDYALAALGNLVPVEVPFAETESSHVQIPGPGHTCTHEQGVAIAKQFRKDLDKVLQRMKAYCNHTSVFDREVGANHMISIRDLESAIMRQGMVLKNIGTPDPYPHSKDPSSPVVEPTADDLKL